MTRVLDIRCYFHLRDWLARWGMITYDLLVVIYSHERSYSRTKFHLFWFGIQDG